MKLKFLQILPVFAMLFAAQVLLTSCGDDKPNTWTGPGSGPDGSYGIINVYFISANTFIYRIEVDKDESYRHVAVPKALLDNYTDLYEGNEKAAIDLLFGIYGADGEGPETYTVKSPTERPSLDVIADKTYVIMAYRTDEAGNPVEGVQKFIFDTDSAWEAYGNISIEIARIAATECDFSYKVTDDIKVVWNYTMFAEDFEAVQKAGGEKALKTYLTTFGTRMLDRFDQGAEWANLEPVTDYVLLVLGIDEKGSHTELYTVPFTTAEPGEIDTEDIVFDRSLIAMCDEEEAGLYSNLFLLANCPMEEDEYGDFYPSETESGILLYCGLLTKAPVDGRIPEGTYQMTEGMDVDCWSYDNTWGVCYTEAGDILEVLFSSGTVEVSYKGDGYLMKFNFETEEGKAFTGTFEGSIAFEM